MARGGSSGLLVAGLLLIAGCASGGSSKAERGPANTGLERLAGQGLGNDGGLASRDQGGAGGRDPSAIPGLEDLLRRQYGAALDIESALRERETASAAPTPRREPPPVWGERPTIPQAPAEAQTPQPESEPEAESEPESAFGDSEPEETAAERRWRLVDELSAHLLREAGDAEEPFEALAGIAALEAVAPGAIERARVRDETGFSLLFPSQEAMLGAMSDLARAWRGGDPDEAAGEAQRVADRLRAGAGLRLPTVKLCRRVDGYGRYEAFSKATFLAGRANEMILYVEVDDFAHAPALWSERDERSGRPSRTTRETEREAVDERHADAFAVELTQSVQLWRDRDNLLVWSQPVQRDRWVSRNRVRDFYLVNRIILPSTVSTGRYTLKVVMRDANQPGGVAEAAIPIEVVSDPRLLE
ncbi:MAG: hypothetical protein EA378_03550 [Phycisphaerales bacterium]|nr:MAG: hypothetical protein EA378_03550 [Phycisphaerales bacterium]